jgi:tetratricopeptide (TPR) repeat protein/tRNA A-37 threonylcarbamoyl transferase component Bud32
MSREAPEVIEEVITVAVGPRPRAGAPKRAGEFSRGALVDRYVLLDLLGNGAMGAVYSAYDPQLDRRVAIKILHRWLQSDASDNDFRARLVREAQTMGRLSHPNVVAVYDVGVSPDGWVFLAMEIVEGGTLAAWLKEKAPPWREVLRMFCQAGEGLAAAHRAGIIHRDFKLDNVLLGVDGRPRVTDFGIAHTAEHDLRGAPSPSSADPPAPPPEVGTLSALSLSGNGRLTLTGTILGTPGYMAPEQFDASRDIDERADVFSFCATLYRALYGERAFDGETLEQIASATLNGRVRPAPKGSAVPGWLRRELLRGLSTDRDARPRSMGELLAALRADPARRRNRWLAAVALGAAAGLAAAAVHGSTQRRTQACRAMAHPFAGVWDGPRKAAIERAFRATGVAYAPDTWARVEREIDRYTASWTAEAESACVATRVHRERSEKTFELQLACLDDRLDELRALSDTLAAPDAMTVEKAIPAVGALSPISPCANLDRLSVSGQLPSDASARREIRALQGEVAIAKALIDSGKEVQGLERLGAVAQRVERTEYGPLVVSFALAKGRAEAAGDPGAAASDFERAALLADAHKLDPQKAEAFIELSTQAHALARFDESHRWTLLATAAIDRIGGDAALEVQRDVAEGWTYCCESKYEKAVPLLERALDRAHGARLAAPDLVAEAHAGLADAFSAQDRADPALDHMRVALRTVEDAYGAQHPAVAQQMVNLATTQLDAERPGDALATAAMAEAMLDAAAKRGDIPATSARIGDAARTVGLALLRTGHPAEAAGKLARALDIFRAGGKESDEMALAATQLAEARRRLGDRTGALALLDQAAEIERRVINIPAETIAGTLAVRGRIALDRRETVQALQFAVQALDAIKSDELGAAQEALASARERHGRDPREARRIAEETADVFGGMLALLP